METKATARWAGKIWYAPRLRVAVPTVAGVWLGAAIVAMLKNAHRVAGVAALALAVTVAQGSPVAHVLDRAAMPVSAAHNRVMLGLANAGTRIVAVGERGLIVLSDDQGKTWRQAKVPVSIALTAVMFPTPATGWAVGHAGTILRSTDGGASWVKQLDGLSLIALLDNAFASAAPAQRAMALQFAADGPDKPFLDVYFYDAQRGVVVGAYGLALRTEDGGATWQPLMGQLDNPKGLHIYALAGRGDQLWLAGEQGFLARSSDAGKSFVAVPSPYQGSFFAAALLPDGDVLVGGLKGNLYRLNPMGVPVRKVEGLPPVSLSAMAMRGEQVMFTNQAGQLFASTDGGANVRQVATAHPGAPLSSLLYGSTGRLIGAGVRGVQAVATRGAE
ncbi:MAG: YCF48-related protein [Pseudomonadota bacterium]